MTKIVVVPCQPIPTNNADERMQFSHRMGPRGYNTIRYRARCALTWTSLGPCLPTAPPYNAPRSFLDGGNDGEPGALQVFFGRVSAIISLRSMVVRSFWRCSGSRLSSPFTWSCLTMLTHRLIRELWETS